MLMRSSVRRGIGFIAATSCALWAGAWQDGLAQGSQPPIDVAVYADHYVLAGRVIDDADVLERTVGAQRGKAVRLAACGAGTMRAHMAAAHRLRDTHLELQVAGASTAGCPAAMDARAVQVSQRPGQRPYNIDDEKVARWWLGIMP